ncbi:MAG: IclR family transcriptional regulator [Dehalococcoidia bacterium]
MIVRQVANALEVIEYFSRRKEPLTLAELVDEFQWPRSSTFNLITTFVDRGYMYEPGPRGKYYPTPKWLAIANAISEAEPIPAAVYKLIRQLVKSTGETVFIGAYSGASAVIVAAVESDAELRYSAFIGKKLPILDTATGRAILAQCSEDERLSVIRRVEKERGKGSSRSAAKQLEAHIAEGLKRGWFQVLKTFTPNIAGVSIPFNLRGRNLAITIAGPVFRIENRVESLGRQLRDAFERYKHPESK